MMPDKWPGDFVSGEKVIGIYGAGIVATRLYCMGFGKEFEGKKIRNAGIRRNLVPVIYESVGCFWNSPPQLKKLIK